MTWTDIAAIVGASAWLIPVFQWIYKAIRRPKIEIVLAPKLWLGYTNSGPLITITSSISTQNKDVIVTKISIKVKHKSGEERLFTWYSITEPLFDFQVSAVEPLKMNKNQTVLAIKAVENTLSERHIGFSDELFSKESRKKTDLAIEHFNFLNGKSKTATKQMLSSKEFDVVSKYLTENIFWREGNYSLEIIIEGKPLNKPHIENYEMSLTKNDIEYLQKNIEAIRNYLRKTIINDPLNFKWEFICTDIFPKTE